MAVEQPDGKVEIVPASAEKLEQTHFLMLRDGEVWFDGNAAKLRGSTDEYLRLFMS
jgi:hypothetical protein